MKEPKKILFISSVRQTVTTEQRKHIYNLYGEFRVDCLEHVWDFGCENEEFLGQIGAGYDVIITYLPNWLVAGWSYQLATGDSKIITRYGNNILIPVYNPFTHYGFCRLDGSFLAAHQ